MTELQRLEKARETLISYMLMKAAQRDWHGVADAAMDLRELEIKILAEREKSEPRDERGL